MHQKDYKYLYEKYKKKYIKLKGGAGVTTVSTVSTVSTLPSKDIKISTGVTTVSAVSALSSKDIKRSEPFDQSIFETSTATNKLDKEIKEEIKKLNEENKFELGNIQYEEQFITYFKNKYSLWKNLENKASVTTSLFQLLFIKIDQLIKEFKKQFNDKKISDHSIIFHTVNDIKVVSVNLLDDTYGILAMMYFTFKFQNIKKIYILALTIALDILRNERMLKTIEIITNLAPDIICFQELNSKMLQILETELSNIDFRHVKNNTLDTVKFNKSTYKREQYRCIFYKSSKVELVKNIFNILSGEIEFFNKSYPILVYKNVMFISVHFLWRFNLNNKKKELVSEIANQLNEFLSNLIKVANEVAKKYNNFKITKIVLIGDTNNTLANLQKAINNGPLKTNTQVYGSDKNTFYTDLNGGRNLDNIIEISIT